MKNLILTTALVAATAAPAMAWQIQYSHMALSTNQEPVNAYIYNYVAQNNNALSDLAISQSDKIVAKNKQISALNKTISGLEADKDQLETEVSALEVMMSSLEADLAAEKATSALYNDWYVEVSNMLAAKNDELKVVKADLAAAQEEAAKVPGLEKSLDAARTQRDNYKKWWIQRKYEAKELSAELADLNGKIDAAAAHGATLGSSVSMEDAPSTKVDFDNHKTGFYNVKKADWVLVEGEGYTVKWNADFYIVNGSQSQVEGAFQYIADEVYDEGFADGYTEGYTDGYADGWNDAIDSIK